MIKLKMSHDSFINDIHPLIRAFYPGEEIEVEYFDGGRKSFGFLLKAMRGSETLVSFSMPDSSDYDRIGMKNMLKCRLYEELSRHSGISLPWGTLTGIRPVRLAMNFISEGAEAFEAAFLMREQYLVSPEKADLAVDIAERELKTIEEVNEPGAFSLYIGIPFCPTTCLYCSFTSNPISLWENRVGEYLDCLFKELYTVAEIFKGKPLTSVYVGGGTPTTLSPDELKCLFDDLYSLFDMKGIREFTVEAGRPDSITPDKLKIMKDYGVDRLSVNPQTMNDVTLKKIGRNHTSADTVRAFNEARDAGFDNINMDLILGLPDEGEKELSHTLSEIEKLKPDDLTIHSLSVKRGSALMENIDEFGYKCLNNTESMMELAAKAARNMGLKPYYLYRQKNMSGNFENTGWARPGKEGIYNILMMEEVQSIPAVGAGVVSKYVVSKDDIRRDGNVKDLKQYMERIDEMTGRKRMLFEAGV